MTTETLTRCGKLGALRTGFQTCPNKARYKVIHIWHGVEASEYVCGRHTGWYRRNGNYEIQEMEVGT